MPDRDSRQSTFENEHLRVPRTGTLRAVCWKSPTSISTSHPNLMFYVIRRHQQERAPKPRLSAVCSINMASANTTTLTTRTRFSFLYAGLGHTTRGTRTPVNVPSHSAFTERSSSGLLISSKQASEELHPLHIEALKCRSGEHFITTLC